LNFHSYIIIAIFSLFLFSSKTRATASVLLFVYLIYYTVALQFNGLARYMAVGTLEALAGLYLLHASKHVLFKHEDTSIAETYFLSVFVNVLGGILYWNYYPKEYYDNMCITLMVIQIIILSWRVFKDAKFIGRCSLLYPLFGILVGCINKRYSFLQAKKKKS